MIDKSPDSGKKKQVDQEAEDQAADNLASASDDGNIRIEPKPEVAEEAVSDDCADEDAVGDDCADADYKVDWDVNSMLNHPSGVDYAIAQNLELMERQTQDLIANGSVEDLLAALEENSRQLEMLKERMDGNFGWMTSMA